VAGDRGLAGLRREAAVRLRRAVRPRPRRSSASGPGGGDGSRSCGRGSGSSSAATTSSGRSSGWGHARRARRMRSRWRGRRTQRDLPGFRCHPGRENASPCVQWPVGETFRRVRCVPSSRPTRWGRGTAQGVRSGSCPRNRGLGTGALARPSQAGLQTGLYGLPTVSPSGWSTSSNRPWAGGRARSGHLGEPRGVVNRRATSRPRSGGGPWSLPSPMELSVCSERPLRGVATARS
jgi:hypothetical protein